MRLFGLDYFYSTPAGVSSRAKKMRRKKSVEFGNYGATNHLASGNKVQANFALHLREYDGIDVDIDAATSGASSEGEDDDDPPPPPNVTPPPSPPSPPPPPPPAATSSPLSSSDPTKSGHAFRWPENMRERQLRQQSSEEEECDSGESYVEPHDRFEFGRGIKPFELPGDHSDNSLSSEDDYDTFELRRTLNKKSASKSLKTAVGAWQQLRKQSQAKQHAIGAIDAAATRRQEKNSRRALHAWRDAAVASKVRSNDEYQQINTIRRTYVLREWTMATRAAEYNRLRILSKCFARLQDAAAEGISSQAKYIAADEYFQLRSKHVALDTWLTWTRRRLLVERHGMQARARNELARKKTIMDAWRTEAQERAAARFGDAAAETMHEANVLRKVMRSLRGNAHKMMDERNAQVHMNRVRSRIAVRRLTDWMLRRRHAARLENVAATYHRLQTLSSRLLSWQKFVDKRAASAAADAHFRAHALRKCLRTLRERVRCAAKERDFTWLANEFHARSLQKGCVSVWKNAVRAGRWMRRGDYFRGIILMTTRFQKWKRLVARSRTIRAAADRIEDLKMSQSMRALKEHAVERAFRRRQEYKADDYYFFKLASATWAILVRHARSRQLERASIAFAVSFRRKTLLSHHFSQWRRGVEIPRQMANAYASVVLSKRAAEIFRAWKVRTFMWVPLHEVNFCRWVARLLQAWRVYAVKRAAKRAALEYALLQRRRNTLTAVFSSWADLVDMKRCRKIVMFMAGTHANVARLARCFGSWKRVCAPMIEERRKAYVAGEFARMHLTERSFARWKRISVLKRLDFSSDTGTNPAVSSMFPRSSTSARRYPARRQVWK